MPLLVCLFDMQSVEVSSQSDCVLCKHQNVIKTNRSGFLISFSFCLFVVAVIVVGLCVAESAKWGNKQAEASNTLWMSFHFHYVAFLLLYDLMHNKCIHAVSNTDFFIPSPGERATNVYWKWKFYSSLFGLAKMADYISLMIALAFPSHQTKFSVWRKKKMEARGKRAKRVKKKLYQD